jgi:hypothetical protein
LRLGDILPGYILRRFFQGGVQAVDNSSPRKGILDNGTVDDGSASREIFASIARNRRFTRGDAVLRP